MMGCDLFVILRNGEWTPEGPWKRLFKFGVNSLQPGEDDVDQDDLSYLLGKTTFCPHELQCVGTFPP
jgi:hypothetical protein